MKTIRVTTKDGTSWTTSANGTQKELNDYFVNQWFDVGVYPIEKMEQAAKVEILNTYLATFNGCELGAIGSRETFKNIEVLGSNEEDARLKLYDNFERIQSLQLNLV